MSNPDALTEAINKLSAATQDHYRDVSGHKDWIYTDIPFMAETWYDLLMDALGDDNIWVISSTVKNTPDQQRIIRCTALISPNGLRKVIPEMMAKLTGNSLSEDTKDTPNG